MTPAMMGTRSKLALAAAVFLTLLLALWVAESAITVLRSARLPAGQGIFDTPAQAAIPTLHESNGVLVESWRYEAVQCAWVYPAGPRKGTRCLAVEHTLTGYCHAHEARARAAGLIH